MNSEQDERQVMEIVQTQQVEIESLKKQMRLQEFQSKQQKLEVLQQIQNQLNNSLEQIKKRNDELERELHNQIEYADKTKLQEFAKSMQQQLAKAEELILIYQENEIRYLKEIQQLKAQQQNDQIEDLKQQLQKMEETAISLICEKEVIISEQAKEIEMLKYNEKLIDSHITVDHQNQLHEIQNAEIKIQEYQRKLDIQQQLHEDQIAGLDRVISQRIFESLEQEMNQSKMIEQDLLHQINILEEKNKYYEKLISDQERKINQLREEKIQEQANGEKRYQEISARLSSALQQVLKSDKKCENAYVQFSLLTREKQSMTKQKEDLIRKQVYQENQIRKHVQALKEFKELSEALQQQVNEQEQQIHDQNECIQKMTQHYDQQIKILAQTPQKFQFNDHEITIQNQGVMLSDILKDSQVGEQSKNDHQDSPTISISQTPTSHMSDSYCSFQTKNSARRKYNGHAKYESLKDALYDAKHTIKIQNLEISNLEQTVEILQKELKSQLLEIHQIRKVKLDFSGEKDHKMEIEKLKLCLNTMETHYLTTKLSLAEEINFLKDELKRAEQDTLQAKVQLAQLHVQHCMLQQKFSKFDKHSNNLTSRQTQNVEDNSPNKGRKSIFSIFR